jgi:hypothetical protein
MDMTNEQRLSRMCLYDLMVSIRRNITGRAWAYCPIEVVNGKKPKCIVKEGSPPPLDCEKCVAEWLGEEET